jgi:hypothetical protein
MSGNVYSPVIRMCAIIGFPDKSVKRTPIDQPELTRPGLKGQAAVTVSFKPQLGAHIYLNIPDKSFPSAVISNSFAYSFKKLIVLL